jgi:hypothetical protein
MVRVYILASRAVWKTRGESNYSFSFVVRLRGGSELNQCIISIDLGVRDITDFHIVVINMAVSFIYFAIAVKVHKSMKHRMVWESRKIDAYHNSNSVLMRNSAVQLSQYYTLLVFRECYAL